MKERIDVACSEYHIRLHNHGAHVQCFARLRLHLIDPRLVDLDWVRVDEQRLVVDDATHQRVQEVTQLALTARVTIEADDHLDDHWTSGDDVRHPLHLGAVETACRNS